MARISTAYSKILAILIAWLGFSCEDKHETILPCEYGTPTATFKAKGVVVSQTDDAPIEGIRAVLKAHWGAEGWRGIDTVYTDNKGVFNLKSKKNINYFRTFFVELNDVDGEENGLFIEKDVEADFFNLKFTGGDMKWYYGEVEKDLGIVKLETKE